MSICLMGIRLASGAAAIALLSALLPYPSLAQISDDRHRDLIADGQGDHSHGADGPSADGPSADGPSADGPGTEGHGTDGHGTDGHDAEGHDAADMSDMEGHDSGSMGEHSHGTLSILEGQPTPEVTLTVYDDALRGWNLELEVENFTLAPEEVNQASNTIEGHAHLYVNGDKMTRLYGPWFYLESLPSGEHELRVELNANGHEVLMHDGEAIADTVVIQVP
ncbi:MAG: hypothetical protein ACFB5Z_06930 [Elainellaceae cyanobacterium]